MLERLASRLTEWLVCQQVIQRDDARIYVYGFDCLLASACQILCLLLLSLATGKWGEVFCFSLSFTVIKRQAGGIHLPGHLSCIAVFTVCAAVGVWLCAVLTPVAVSVAIPVAVLAFGILWRKAPIENLHNPKTPQELRLCRMRCRGRLILLCIGLPPLLLWLPGCALSVALGLSLVSISLLVKNRKGG